MPFIGQEPQIGAYHVLDSITASATATYNLQLNGGAFSPASANHLVVSLNGVIQKPGTSFNVSGSQITFSSALTSLDSIDFVMALGNVLDVGTPTDGSVSTNKIATGAVTGAKIETNPTIAGNLTVSGTSTNTGLITASAGIAIGGTDVAHTLDEYEEGTWTPNLIGSTSNPSGTVTGTGTYTRIGRLIHANYNFSNQDVAGAAGGIRITGLPYTQVGTHVGGDVMVYYRKDGQSDAINLSPYLSGDTLFFYQTRNGATEVWAEITFNVASASTGFYLWGSISYETAT